MAKSQQTQIAEDTVEVAVDEATHAQLFWFSRNHLNLDVDEAETLNQTLSRLKAAWEHPVITVPKSISFSAKTSAADPDAVVVTSSDDRYGLPEFVEIIVQGGGDDSDDVQQVAHNGKTYLIKKGVPVIVPWYVYKILDDAVEVRYSSGRDTGLGPEIRRHSVSFSRIK